MNANFIANALLKGKLYWSNKKFVHLAISSILLLVASLVFNFFAGAYALHNVSNSVDDLLLDVLPLLNVRLIVLHASLLFVIGVLVGLFMHPSKLPFTLKSLSLFIVVRSIFINLTHMAPYLGIEYQQSFVTPGSLIQKFTFGGDLFFSGHTGIPFLLALIFWQNKRLRWLFLVSSIISGSAMLFGHLHYSIDVFAAFFITHSIYSISKYWFKKDYQVFTRGLEGL